MKIQIYDLHDKKTQVVPTYQQARFNPELEAFIQDNWNTNHTGWTDSYLPCAHSLFFPQGNLTIRADYMRYSEVAGMIKAIEQGEPFAPEVIPRLSVGIYAVTPDNKLILPRRSSKVKHAPNMYNNFAGWMASMNIAPRDKCEDPKFARDPRLYDSLWQAVQETTEESQLLPIAEFDIDKNLVSAVIGFSHSFNPMLNFVARTFLRASDVRERILGEQEEFAEGRKEHDKVAAVNLNHLYELLRNQPELHQEDPKTFEPSDDRELILIDHVIGGLVTHFQDLTRRPRPMGFIEDLRKGGIDISEMDTSPMKSYPLR